MKTIFKPQSSARSKEKLFIQSLKLGFIKLPLFLKKKFRVFEYLRIYFLDCPELFC